MLMRSQRAPYAGRGSLPTESAMMARTDKQAAFRVVGFRRDGERVLISAHASREVAEKVMRLIVNCSGFRELLIEEAGPPEMAAANNGHSEGPQ